MSQIPSMMSYDKMLTPGHMETRSWNRISLVPRSFFHTPSTSTRAFFLQINLYPTHLTPLITSAYFKNTYKQNHVVYVLVWFLSTLFWGYSIMLLHATMVWYFSLPYSISLHEYPLFIHSTLNSYFICFKILDSLYIIMLCIFFLNEILNNHH